MRVSLIDLLYPPACLLCQAPLRSAHPPRDGELLCQACQQAMPKNGPPVCLTCGIELAGAFDAVPTCPRCAASPRAFELARAPWKYAGAAQQAIRQFKYHRRWSIGDWLAKTMVTTARQSLPIQQVTAVLPVPAHGITRFLKGGFPAGSLARAIARALRAPYAPAALRQRRWVRTQTGLAANARVTNVRQAFAADTTKVRGHTILLIDDVLTSGATAEACASALKDAGARAVYVLTAARTPLTS